MSRDEHTIETDRLGIDLLSHPLLNKGTAFTEDERDVFELHACCRRTSAPSISRSRARVKALRGCDDPLEAYAFMRDLQDVNETLFYALLVRNLPGLLPVVYTPTVGEGCQRFSEIWRRPRGLFFSYPNGTASPRSSPARASIVCASSSSATASASSASAIQGTGGMGIPIGKLSLYTACAGIHPGRTLPIFLDVGTDNQERLADPMYVGWRSPRVRGAEYDAFVESFITAVHQRWPDILLQWEDFANHNAGTLLERYRDRLCSFNDDIQGTAAVAAGALLSAIGITGVPLTEQRIVIVGAGSAGCGIAALLLRAMIDAGLSPADASRKFYAIDRDGLLVDDMPGIRPVQQPFVQPRAALSGWILDRPDAIGLADVARNAAPTVLIGVSGQPGAFTESAVRRMAAQTRRPIIFPLSNPTSRAEATPQDLMTWTDGRALIGTGSPFDPVQWADRLIPIAQTNNSYIFPGVGLGILAVGARRVTDAMFTAAARALAELSPARSDPGAPCCRLSSACARSPSPSPTPSPCRPRPTASPTPARQISWPCASPRRSGSPCISPIVVFLNACAR